MRNEGEEEGARGIYRPHTEGTEAQSFFRTQRRAGARREDTEGEKKGEGNEQLIKNEE